MSCIETDWSGGMSVGYNTGPTIHPHGQWIIAQCIMVSLAHAKHISCHFQDCKALLVTHVSS